MSELEKYRQTMSGEVLRSWAVDAQSEINRLKEELEEAENKWMKYRDRVQNLERQLAEASAEVERLKQLHLSGRYTVEQTATGVRICYGHHEKHEPCEYSEFIDKQQARREVAKECAAIADKYKTIENNDAEILYGKAIGDDIRETFGLEAQGE